MKDAVIIGSGAGGGPLALTLARAGLEVLVLEKGPRYGPDDYVHDEIAMAAQSGFFVPTLAEDPHTVLFAGKDRAELSQLGWVARCVGGGTAHMGAYLYRFHPDDFRMRSRFGEYEELEDWPFGYGELEPYYTRAEWEVGVSGAAGANPFEGPRSRPYPMPPLASHPLSSCLDESCARLGLNAFPTPRAVNSRPYQGRPACTYCRSCAGYGCAVGARGSTQAALLPRAEETGRCEIRSGAMVREITMGRDGRATGCIYLDEAGDEIEVHARIVCVCCSAVESARLLLLSRSPRFPDGLANGNGLVGRHLQFHGVSTGEARFRHASHDGRPLRDPHPFLGRSVMDHYFLPPGVSDLSKGGLLRFGLPTAGPVAVGKNLARAGGSLAWGPELKRRIREYFCDYQTVYFEVFHDFIANAGTFVDLDPEVRDRWGLPVARIHLRPGEHQKAAGRWLVERGMEVLAGMGADELLPGACGDTAMFLVHGTCRAGSDPETSVLDRNCRAHEVPNLFVVDGSFMPTSGGAPPTLTILANSFRVADHIVEEQ
ncbi:MAG TPA: GMC family oxidoreductase [Thermoanaerobaculia bacterium]|nr:GMC family oxidoreductase [Thermoanaerobaculia bacterium]